MHPKQRTIMHNMHITKVCSNWFELMIGIAFNSRLAIPFVLTVTRRRAWHVAWILVNHNPAKYNCQYILTHYYYIIGIIFNVRFVTLFFNSECLDIAHPIECARTDDSGPHFAYDIEIIPRTVIRAWSPVGFTSQGRIWARSVTLAHQGVLRRRTLVHDYWRLYVYMLVTFIDLVAHGK